MRIIMTYDVGDGCSWNAEITKPIEYESVEKAEYDFLELCERAQIKGNRFNFCGEEYYFDDFYWTKETLSKKGVVKESKQHYKGPQFRTIDDWFEQEKKVDYK